VASNVRVTEWIEMDLKKKVVAYIEVPSLLFFWKKGGKPRNPTD
jgi:hypothetical protein